MRVSATLESRITRAAAVQWTLLLSLLFSLLLSSGCASPGRSAYQRGIEKLQGQEYGEAIIEFDKALAAEPDMKLAVYGKARAHYELKDFEIALALFEDFLAKTESEGGTFKQERWDSEFYRDKCKQELGQEVEQNAEAIPEPPMGE